ncbi:peptide deformylase [Candidatus Falkowbacteria bacterium CG_4_10_14_0_2_um_filter_36_22]|nr:MAG: peptide deformylase [Candidatus Falkowbacteria bacterium CG_4_8_14_3_um_filter_36_11]PJA10181.1 MAG: peptide deformylase [Candidatus Falkowbacteria bacterium CG_4_10_14_0_2_um_filter_36_22]
MHKILNIITEPNGILRQKSLSLNQKEIKSNKIKKLCSDMAKTMLKKDGIGLAAPQIGKNIRIIIINTKEKPICMINPIITYKSWAKEWGEEGCLSVPNVFGKVKRCKKIKYKYFDNKGNKLIVNAEGLMARVIQHEIDHLDGILFIDKAKNIKKEI